MQAIVFIKLRAEFPDGKAASGLEVVVPMPPGVQRLSCEHATEVCALHLAPSADLCCASRRHLQMQCFHHRPWHIAGEAFRVTILGLAGEGTASGLEVQARAGQFRAHAEGERMLHQLGTAVVAAAMVWHPAHLWLGPWHSKQDCNTASRCSGRRHTSAGSLQLPACWYGVKAAQACFMLADI